MTSVGRGLVYGLMNLLLLVGLIGCSTSQEQRSDIDSRAKVALEDLYRQTPAAPCPLGEPESGPA